MNMETKTIVVVDDDEEIRGLLQEYLQQNGFVTYTASNGEELDAVLAKHDADLIVLDLMLPGEDGFDICRRLRSIIDTPIIMLTAKGDDTDKIVGLEIGADDYLTKPFNPRELLARIKVIFRRFTSPALVKGDSSDLVRFAGWTLDQNLRHLISPNAVVIPLSGAEYKLLEIFIDHPNRVLTRDQLMDWIAGRESTPFDRSIDVQVSRLRQRLDDAGKSPQLIKTVRGEGYLFTPKIERSN